MGQMGLSTQWSTQIQGPRTGSTGSVRFDCHHSEKMYETWHRPGRADRTRCPKPKPAVLPAGLNGAGTERRFYSNSSEVPKLRTFRTKSM